MNYHQNRTNLRFVAGSIGPTNNSKHVAICKRSGYRAVTFDDLRIAYKQQVEALMDGGCDLLW
jgi:5-methyltetrahydrofolate--homocysteine methyltransferase